MDGRGNNTEYVLSGTHLPDTPQGAALPSATAVLVINNAKAFQGTVDLGAYSMVTLAGVRADSYSYDPTHDLLKLYQGNRVVDTLHLNFDSASIPEPWNQLRLQSTGSITYVSDAYHGLSYGIGQHV